MGNALIELGPLLQQPRIGQDDWTIPVAARFVVIQTAHDNLAGMKPPAEAEEYHADLISATADCSAATEQFSRGVDSLDSEYLRSAGELINSCGEKLKALPVGFLQSLIPASSIAPAWGTARLVPRVPIPTPTPSFTATPVPAPTSTAFILFVPTWPIVNPTYTPWIGPTATKEGGSSSSSGGGGDKEDKEVEDDNDEADDADDDKGGGIVCACESNTLNCPESGDKTAIRDCFKQCNDLGKGDVHDLDRDHDGVACDD